MLKRIFFEQKFFLTAFAIWILIAAAMLLAGDKIYWQQWFNNYHFTAADYFFKYFTFLGDGYVIVILCIIMVFYQIRLSLFSLSTFLVSGLFAQMLKRLIFEDVHRPVHVFKKIGIDLEQVLDVGLVSNYSFPSGHTTSAFALFFSLSLILATKNRTLQLVFFLAALLVGISRIYLNQHFINDAITGSILGLVTTMLIYLVFLKLKAPWLNASIVGLLSKKSQNLKTNHEK